MSKMKKKELPEFDIWQNDGLQPEPPPPTEENTMKLEKYVEPGANREYVMRHKKHKYIAANKLKKEQIKRKLGQVTYDEEDSDSDGDKQVFYTQRTDLHFRTCPVCKAAGIIPPPYIKGTCPKCGSEPGEPHPELYKDNDSGVRRNVEGHSYSRDSGVERNIGINQERDYRIKLRRKQYPRDNRGRISTYDQLRNLGSHTHTALKEKAANSKKIKFIKEDAKGWFRS